MPTKSASSPAVRDCLRIAGIRPSESRLCETTSQTSPELTDAARTVDACVTSVPCGTVTTTELSDTLSRLSRWIAAR